MRSGEGRRSLSAPYIGKRRRNRLEGRPASGLEREEGGAWTLVEHALQGLASDSIRSDPIRSDPFRSGVATPRFRSAVKFPS